MKEYSITGTFFELSGGSLTVVTRTSAISVPIVNGAINNTFQADCIERVEGYDITWAHVFTWVPEHESALFFCSSPRGSLQLKALAA